MGNQIVTYSEELYKYRISSSSALSQPWTELAGKTDQLTSARMRSSEDVALMLQTLGLSIKAEKALDIGTFTGCSALALAEIVGDHGSVETFDISNQYQHLWSQYWAEGTVEENINFNHGDAVVGLKSLLDKDLAGGFDIAFIDANKKAYVEVYELCMALVRSGGYLVIDDTLWQGKVVEPDLDDKTLSHILEFNDHVAADKRVIASVLPIGNGLTIALKK